MEENNNPVNVPPPGNFPVPPNGGQQNIPTPPVSMPTPPPPAPNPIPVPPPIPTPPPMPTPSPIRPMGPGVIPPSVPGSVPPPPPPEIGIRTMDSDMKSMQSSGGTGVTPQTFKPEDMFAMPSNSVPNISPKPSASSPIGVPTVKVIGPQKSNRRVIILVCIVIVLILIWAAVQFLVVPALHSSPATPVAPAAVTTNVPVATSTAPAVPTSTPVSFVHQSFFKTAAPVSAAISLASPLTLAGLQGGVASSTMSPKSSGTLEELIFTSGSVALPSTASGTVAAMSSSTPETAQDVLGALLPSASQDFLNSTFAQDVTGFAYYNANGVWPGYIFKLNTGVDLASATSTLNPIIEANPNAFFQASPGALSGSFSDGSLPDGMSVRYGAFSKKGAALEYGWFKGYLVVSTSYQGIISADQRL